MRFILSVLFIILATAVTASDETEIRTLLGNQQAAWNRADIPGFMQGYWQDPALRFASGGDITYGYAETLARYQQRYGDAAQMGKLEFELIEVQTLSKRNAMVFGRWRLHREKDEPNGLFTLTLEKFSDGWKITRDHTSSAD